MGVASTNTFGYNLRSELTSADMDRNYTYDYDPIGNRERAIIGVETNDYAANMLNQYTNITDDATYTPQYDSDGNMTSYGAFDFVWNGENRLIEVKSNGTTIVENAYDYQGRRIEKISGGITTRYIYDGWNLIAESSTGVSPVTKYHVWGLDLSQSLQGAGGVGGLLATIDGTNAYYAAYDANGNITEYVDSTGTVVAHYEYSAFGKITSQSGTKADDFAFRFSTKYFDTETQLYYYGLRFYNPDLGRWINRDPAAQPAFNLVLFVQNNPLLIIDKRGLDNLCPPNQSLCCGVCQNTTVCVITCPPKSPGPKNPNPPGPGIPPPPRDGCAIYLYCGPVAGSMWDHCWTVCVDENGDSEGCRGGSSWRMDIDEDTDCECCGWMGSIVTATITSPAFLIILHEQVRQGVY